MNPPIMRELRQLVDKWNQLARRALASAETYRPGSPERRVAEHGAHCYANCALDLRETMARHRQQPTDD